LDPKEYLTEWIENFVKNKDVILKSIVSVERKIYGLYVKYKDKEKMFFVIPFVSDLNDLLNKLKKINKDKWIGLVVVNNKDNFKLLIKNWKSFVGLGAKFSIYFVNPFSLLDKKWIIFPYTHHRIADKASFDKGMKSMFVMVNDISEKEFLSKIE